MVLTRSLLLAVLLAGPAAAGELPDALPGWVIERTGHGYTELIEQVDAAVAASPLNVVTRASATVGAKSLGQEIPGSRRSSRSGCSRRASPPGSRRRSGCT